MCINRVSKNTENNGNFSNSHWWENGKMYIKHSVKVEMDKLSPHSIVWMKVSSIIFNQKINSKGLHMRSCVNDIREKKKQICKYTII